LEGALKYAKQNCRSPGSVAECKDYVIRSVIIDEIRFNNKSQLFPALSSDPQAYGILTSLGVIVRFYNRKLKRTLNLDEDEVGALIINQETIGRDALYEYDGARLRIFIAGRLSEDAFKTAGVLSIVDILARHKCSAYCKRSESLPSEVNRARLRRTSSRSTSCSKSRGGGNSLPALTQY
jgi:hypothetical protein